MNPVRIYSMCALLGYLLGCFNTAYIIGRLRGRDIRMAGSHNAGATNAVMVFGFRTGLLVAACDMAKTVLAFYAAERLFGDAPLAGLTAAVMSIIGHAYPFWMRFRGGKGFASFLGLILAYSGWHMFSITIVWSAVITLIADRIVFATVSVMILYPLILFRMGVGALAAVMVAICSGVMIAKHKQNIIRILHGEELGFRQMRRRMADGERAEDDS